MPLGNRTEFFMFNVKGCFNESEDKYTLLTPKTKAEYKTCLMNPLGYGFAVNQFGSGITQCKCDFRHMNNIVADRTVYFRDDEANDVWCVGGFPFVSEIEAYSCTHSQSFSEIESVHGGIKVKIRFFVPHDRRCDIQTVEIINLTDRERKISVVPVVHWELSGFKAPAFCGIYQTYSNTFSEELGGLYLDSRNPWADGRAPDSLGAYPYNGILTSTKKVDYYSAVSRSVFGTAESLSYPIGLLDGENLDCRGVAAQPLFSMLQHAVTLGAGESFKTDYIVGICYDRKDAAELMRGIDSCEGVEALLAETVKADAERRSKIWVKTPDAETNRFTNHWLKMGLEWNVLFRRNPRDNLQFANSMISYTPEAVKYTLERLMELQYNDGHALRCWLPIDASHFADESLWYVFTICDYLKFTADYGFLDKTLKYFDEGEGTVLEHLVRAAEVVDGDRGPNGITLSHYADWNDALNTGPYGENAESVFVAMQLALAHRELSELFSHLGDDAKASLYKGKYEDLKKTINEVCWDKEGYYIRSFTGGRKIGSSDCKEGSKIFINPQSWAFIAGVCPEERVDSVYAAIEKYIETDVGCVVNYPPYSKYDEALGRISVQYPGTCENGAIYAHATSFKVYGDCIMGKSDYAFRDYKKLLPENPNNPPEIADTVPYAISNACSTSDLTYGKSSARPWSTGTQSWLFRCVTEGFLGLRYAHGGFNIRPALPTSWDKAELTLKKEGVSYELKITNKNTGSKQIFVNGKKIEGDFVPFSDGERVLIEVML